MLEAAHLHSLLGRPVVFPYFPLGEFHLLAGSFSGESRVSEIPAAGDCPPPRGYSEWAAGSAIICLVSCGRMVAFPKCYLILGRTDIRVVVRTTPSAASGAFLGNPHVNLLAPQQPPRLQKEKRITTSLW